MSKKSLVAPFASLLGMGRARAEDAPADDDDERKQREGESDEDYAKRMDEMDQQEEDARRAEEEEREKDAKGVGAEDEDDDSDDEKDEDVKAARALERSRCARIIAHGIKIGAVRQAGVFAFDTKMSSKHAIAALDAARVDAPAPRRTGLADRMAAARTPNPGAGGGGKPTVAQQIVLAGKKRRGEI